ncbi:MFS transporter [Streptosporangium sp. NPDC004379]|uniref:MFS transporter n=1 Tax=Streptosporangium sp. NPDC004379 TaxID=3366189 RepID=UPI0036C6D1BA
MDTTPEAGAVRAGPRQWAGLAVLALPTLLLSLDMSVLYLALPHLSEELGATATQQLWITDVYGFLIAGFLVTMGGLGDLVGRRKLLLIGAACFTVASVAAAYSSSAEMLIVSRALLGVAGATLMPSTMALLGNMFPDPRQMGTAIAVWMSCFMGGMALGPLVGGLMLQRFWWGSVFLLAIPVMALLLIAGPLLLPEYRDPAGGRVDLVSVVLSLATILPFVYGLKELAKHGWEPQYLLSIAVGIVVGVFFVRRQRTLETPLLDLRLFAHRTFRAALMIMVLGGAASGSFFLVSMFLQTVKGMSPLEAGLWLVPSTGATIASVMLAPVIARRFRPGHVIAAGLAVTAVGYLMLSQVDGSTGMAFVLTGLIVGAVGAGPMGALGTGLIFTSVPPEKTGAASAISETGGEFGIAFGVAVLGSVGAAVYGSQITVPAQVPAEAAAAAREGIAGAVGAAEQVGGTLGAELLTAAREAFTTAMNSATGTSAALALALAVVAAVALGHVPPTGQAEAAEAAEGGPEQAGDAAATAQDGRAGEHSAPAGVAAEAANASG